MVNHMLKCNKNKIKKKRGEMEMQLILVSKNIGIAVSNMCSSIWGKLMLLVTFLSTTFIEIKPMLIIIMILTLIDFIFGIVVTVHKKGVKHIMSGRMRDSLVKLFFYIFLISGLFIVEKQLVDGYYISSKMIFAVASGIELLSISANALILFPNMPILKLFSKLLTKEMSKKLEMSEDELTKNVETKE